MANDRLVDLKVTRVALLTTAPVSLIAPTAAEMAASTDITAWLTAGTDIGFDDSDTVSEMSWSEGQKVEAPTMINYHGALVMFRAFTSGAPGTQDPSTVFNYSFPTVYIYIRQGLPSTTAWAAAQVGQYFKFVADQPKPPYGAGGYVKYNVKLLPQGSAGAFTVAA